MLDMMNVRIGDTRQPGAHLMKLKVRYIHRMHVLIVRSLRVRGLLRECAGARAKLISPRVFYVDATGPLKHYRSNRSSFIDEAFITDEASP